MRASKILVVFVLTLGLAMGQWAFAISLQSRELLPAVEEYLHATQEGQIVDQILVEKDLDVDVYLLGGAAPRVVLAVAEHLAGTRPELPERLIDLLSLSQDLDLVFDLAKRTIDEIEEPLIQRLPYKLGQSSRIQIMTLYPSPGRGVLQNPDFKKQNTDTFSTGLIRLRSRAESQMPSIVDVRQPAQGNGGAFLQSLMQNEIAYLTSAEHSSTTLAADGKNPPVISAIKYIVNLSRFRPNFQDHHVNQAARIIERFVALLKDLDNQEQQSSSTPSLDYDYVLDRIELNLVKGLLEAVDISWTLQLYERVGVFELLKLMDGEFAPSDGIRGLVSTGRETFLRFENGASLEDPSAWTYFFANRQFSSLDLLRSPSGLVPINEVKTLAHGTLIEGSMNYGGEHPAMFLDLESFEFFALRLFEIYVKAMAQPLADEELIALAEKYLFYVNALVEDQALGDAAVKFLNLPDYECAPDCRNDALTANVFYRLLGFETHLAAYKDHAGNWIRFRGRYYQVSSYNEDPEHKSGLFSIEDYEDLENLDGDYKLRVATPQPSEVDMSLARHAETVLAVNNSDSLLSALQYIFGFFEELVGDHRADKELEETLKAAFSNHSKLVASIERLEPEFLEIDVPLRAGISCKIEMRRP